VNVSDINSRLSAGETSPGEFLPHLQDLRRSPRQFRFSFGLDTLPEEPGIIVVRGPRQYGKSTWLEQQIEATIRTHGPGTAFYLNGDDVVSGPALADAVREIIPLFRRDAPVRRLFIDEITAVADWQRAVKRLVDGGSLRTVLVVTTGSKATDLRRGAERLPGRKGRLARTTYLFTPIAYAEFRRVCSAALGAQCLPAYLLTGGSPIACGHIAEGRLPEYVIEIVKDWVYGECAQAGRHRSTLLALMECLVRFGGTPVGQAKMARETGMANNSVAAGYLELLADLMCLSPAHAWDPAHRVALRRRPAKYHLSNTLAALAWHPSRLRTIADFTALSPEAKGAWYEWAVAQELWRRRAIAGVEVPEELCFWQSKEHELDFVLAPGEFLEVKHGRTSPLEFAWFSRVFPKAHLTVISQSRYETANLTGIGLDEFLLQEG
jgi:predicted AAA+ superfamily ATPase